MLKLLVDTDTIRNRLDVLGFSFVGVADSAHVSVDITDYSVADYTISTGCTYVSYNDDRRCLNDSRIEYAMGTEYFDYVEQNSSEVTKGLYVYYVYRVVEELQYENMQCKYSKDQDNVHIPLCTVYHPKRETFYSMCYCGTLEYISKEEKLEYLPTNDTVIVVRK